MLKALNQFIFLSSKEEQLTITEGIYKKFEENKDIQKIKKNKILHSLVTLKSLNLKKFYYQKWKKIVLISSLGISSPSNSNSQTQKKYINLHKRKLSKTE